MASKLPSILLRLNYQKAAEEYLRNLPLTHFMEATAQATQRKITWDSLDLVHSRSPDVQVFNELLLQYPIRGEEHPGQVVPDNMVVRYSEPIKADTSYDLPFQPVGPFWVFEYVSQRSRRKDYDISFQKYERLKIPYYLLFYPDNQELTLFHYGSRKYVSVKPDHNNHFAIVGLEMEVALLDGWVRYWHKNELLPLPADLQRDLDETRQQLRRSNRRVRTLQHRAEAEAQRAEAEAQRAEAEAQRAEAEAQRAEAERQARLAAEQELAQLRARLSENHSRRANGG
ncbi:MAG: Uma2 family endonuclease [Gemmataceae bacterium]